MEYKKLHIKVHKTSLNKLKNIKTTTCVFFDHEE